MAKRECISSLVEIEHRVFLLRTFVEVVAGVDEAEPPAWTLVARQLVKDLEREIEAHGVAVRGAAC